MIIWKTEHFGAFIWIYHRFCEAKPNSGDCQFFDFESERAHFAVVQLQPSGKKLRLVILTYFRLKRLTEQRSTFFHRACKILRMAATPIIKLT